MCPRYASRSARLSDQELTRNVTALVARIRANTAEWLAHIGEMDARGLYKSAGYASTYAYGLSNHDLHLDEERLFHEVEAAHVAWRFPAIFPAIAQGKLDVEVVCLLAPHLTRESADDVLAAAAYKTKYEMLDLLDRWFPPKAR